MKHLVLFLLWISTGSVLATDSCDDQLPESLKSMIPEIFPGFRAPNTNDNLADDVEWDLKEGGRGCLGVASADFDGAGDQDFILGLSAVQGSDALVAVALAQGQSWKLQVLSERGGPRSRLYVTTDKPGTYRRTEALDGPLEAGEVDTLECAHSVAVYGAVESSGVAYCYSNGQWQHVWVSD